MAKYFYEKYNTNFHKGTEVLGEWVIYGEYDVVSLQTILYTGYTESGGLVSVSGVSNPASWFIDRKQTGYRRITSSLFRYGNWDYNYARVESANISIVGSYYYKGSYITTIAAEDGTYPANGRYVMDGYWYIRAGIATVGNIPSISATGLLKSKEVINVNWGSGTRIETYYVDVSFDLTSWTSVYTGTSLTTKYTIPKKEKLMQFRVRGYGNSQFTPYTYSPLYDVKTFPEMGIKANGSLKYSSDGWVMVNGQLREISDIYVKVNDTLKEL